MSIKKKILFDRFSKAFFIYFIISLTISFILLFYYTIQGGELNLIGKTFRASMYNLVNSFVVLTAYNIINRFGLNEFLKYSFFLYLTLLLWLTLELLGLDLLNFFHAYEYLNHTIRIRLSTSEVSQAYPLFIIVSCLAYLYLNTIKVSYFLKNAFILFVLLASSQIISKGGILVLVSSIFLTYLIVFNIKRIIIWIPIMVIFLAISMFLISDKIVPMILADIELYTSFSTRLVGFMSIFSSLWTYPFGQGYGTYIVYLPEVFENMIRVIDSYIGFELNYNELNTIIRTGENLGVKSGIGFQLIQTGIVGLIFYIYIFGKLFNNINRIDSLHIKFTMYFVSLFTLLEIIFFVNFEVFYIYLLLFPISVVLSKRKVKV